MCGRQFRLNGTSPKIFLGRNICCCWRARQINIKKVSVSFSTTNLHTFTCLLINNNKKNVFFCLKCGADACLRKTTIIKKTIIKFSHKKPFFVSFSSKTSENHMARIKLPLAIRVIHNFSNKTGIQHQCAKINKSFSKNVE